MASKKTLVIGASDNPQRYANRADKMLSNYGHSVVALGNKEGRIEETVIKIHFPKEKDFNTVTLYLNPQRQAEYEEEILNMQPKRVIFNPGTENVPFMEKLEGMGIEVEAACTLVMLSIGNY